jgi:creatinine amidohydrolase/Fe(II)-dependent formamide hydrolase-like protein
MDMLREITPSGVIGDATRATAETGERILAAAVPRLAQVASELAASASRVIPA